MFPPNRSMFLLTRSKLLLIRSMFPLIRSMFPLIRSKLLLIRSKLRPCCPTAFDLARRYVRGCRLLRLSRWRRRRLYLPAR